jgi:alpha-mannosidase
LTASDQMYKDITPEIRAKLPEYTGDLLLIEHSAGSLTSQAYMKRSNRKNELLATSAEQVASFADWLGEAAYPFTKLNNSWDLVLGSQFHDILPGTSIPKAYEYAWNDEFIAANGFSEVMKNSLKVISHGLNTNMKGRALVVYNPVAQEREDVATAELTYAVLPENIIVMDQNGKKLPCQIIEHKDGKLKFIFLAKLPSMGLAVFDVRESNEKPVVNAKLSVTDQTIENEYYKVKIASNGDIESIFDKKLSKELLAKPAQLEFLKEIPANWPSWNMDWKDRQNPPIDFMNKEASVSVTENGPVRVSLRIERKGLNSEIEQIIGLTAGEAGKRIEITNKIDWQSKEVSLKASFPLTASNEKATYNLGVGTIQRTNNNKVKFEVPSKEWFDLTDKSGAYGVSILEDCKFGSDKPDDNTIRLTLLYTPGINRSTSWCWYQGTQDWGVHDMKYGIYGHKGDWVAGQSYWQAKFLNEPLVAFETSKHEGYLGKEISLVKAGSSQLGILAFKKMEEGDYYIVRVNELNGLDAKGVSLTFPARIADAYEVNGQEKKIGTVDFKNNSLNFDITHYTIRSFAIRFQPPTNKLSVPFQVALQLPYNADVITFDDNRWDCNNERGGLSYPAELIPPEIVSEDIRFKMGNTADQQNNAVIANGQVINLPAGDYTKLYLLASADGDTRGDFIVDGLTLSLQIQDWKGYIGQFYNRNLNMDDHSLKNIDKPFLKNNNIAWFASHFHKSYPTANIAYQYCYLYKYEINLPAGAKSIKLPVNRRIRILAATLAKNSPEDIDLSLPLFDDFKDSKAVQIRK